MTIVAITGIPGIGKTTICQKLAQLLKRKYTVSGFLTAERRTQGKRIGFDLRNFSDGENQQIPLATESSRLPGVKARSMPTVGKYSVHVQEFDDFLKRENIFIGPVWLNVNFISNLRTFI